MVATRNSKQQDTPEAALQDLVSIVLRSRKPATFAELCDVVDRGPSRVREAVVALRASGVRIRVAGMRSFAC